MAENDEGNEGILSYPSMDDGGQVESEGSAKGLDTEEAGQEQPSVEFSAEDQATLGEMNELLDTGSYDELGEIVEGELRALELPDDKLEPELRLLKYAKEWATESDEWKQWMRGALNNLFTHKTKMRSE